MKTVRFLSFLLVLVGSLACSTREDVISPEYAENIKRYFAEVHQEELSEDQSFLVIPLGGCSPCLKELMDSLVAQSYNLNMLFSGETSDNDLKALGTVIQERYPLMKDKENLMMRYRTNIFGPTIMTFESGRIVGFVEIDTQNMSMELAKIPLRKQ